jgi:taurine-pyruvate aminotransferase
VAAAVALRNIEIMEAENVLDGSAETGTYLLDGLRTLMRHKLVGDVRGKGLLLGLELVKDRTTQERLGPAQITAIVEFCSDNGVIAGRGGHRNGNTITLSPPLVITRVECGRIVEILDRAPGTLDPG